MKGELVWAIVMLANMDYHDPSIGSHWELYAVTDHKSYQSCALEAAQIHRAHIQMTDAMEDMVLTFGCVMVPDDVFGEER